MQSYCCLANLCLRSSYSHGGRKASVGMYTPTTLWVFVIVVSSLHIKGMNADRKKGTAGDEKRDFNLADRSALLMPIRKIHAREKAESFCLHVRDTLQGR